MKRSPIRAAFTLIELLVVIAIIALLAGIALTAYGSAMEKAHSVKCLANLKNIGQGVALYLQDNDDDFFSKSGSNKTWPQTLKDKYNISYKAMRSPFDKITGSRPDVESGQNVPISYGLNDDCYDTNTGKWTSTSELIIGAPALDSGTALKFSGRATENVTLRKPSGGGASKQGTHGNRNRINALFGDGRVETMIFKDYATTANEEGQRRWNPLYDKGN
ncbi:MAG TPA: prepilin-type N-terminal cleavage/methylation domain-containing protein [Chthoniobacteraceae bacterium]|nr:prepilin-type N-terminal cleavage/methylation domain-containing protein [Chthoniobacteraceae bacterium]